MQRVHRRVPLGGPCSQKQNTPPICPSEKRGGWGWGWYVVRRLGTNTLDSTLTVGWSDQPMLSLSVARKAAGSGWQLFQAGLGGSGLMTGRSADRCADTAPPRYPPFGADLAVEGGENSDGVVGPALSRCPPGCRSGVAAGHAEAARSAPPSSSAISSAGAELERGSKTVLALVWDRGGGKN